MPAYVGNEGENLAQQRILVGQTFDMYYHSNTDAEIQAMGEDRTLADFDLNTNLVFSAPGAANAVPGTNKITLAGNDFIIPTGANLGNPATHPQVSAVAGAGGAGSTNGGNTTGGYVLVDVATGLVLVAASHPEVASSGNKKAMAEDAIFRVDPSLGVE